MLLQIIIGIFFLVVIIKILNNSRRTSKKSDELVQLLTKVHETEEERVLRIEEQKELSPKGFWGELNR